ncbi:hypothetical protein BJ912DRAFT_705463 [Pholiota molesta]|nr:hypothetical protein BJ912DRAFT_705463 [Pholiota molesta]
MGTIARRSHAARSARTSQAHRRRSDDTTNGTGDIYGHRGIVRNETTTLDRSRRGLDDGGSTRRGRAQGCSAAGKSVSPTLPSPQKTFSPHYSLEDDGARQRQDSPASHCDTRRHVAGSTTRRHCCNRECKGDIRTPEESHQRATTLGYVTNESRPVA